MLQENLFLKVHMGEKNDQVDRCCCLCLSHRNVGAGHVARAASQPDGMITQVREACGAGMHMVNGVCVRTAARRNAARCAVGMRTGWPLRSLKCPLRGQEREGSGVRYLSRPPLSPANCGPRASASAGALSSEKVPNLRSVNVAILSPNRGLFAWVGTR
jgi:hypothetical protein